KEADSRSREVAERNDQDRRGVPELTCGACRHLATGKSATFRLSSPEPCVALHGLSRPGCSKGAGRSLLIDVLTEWRLTELAASRTFGRCIGRCFTTIVKALDLLATFFDAWHGRVRAERWADALSKLWRIERRRPPFLQALHDGAAGPLRLLFLPEQSRCQLLRQLWCARAARARRNQACHAPLRRHQGFDGTDSRQRSRAGQGNPGA